MNTDIKQKQRGRPKASKQIDKKIILEHAIAEFANKGFDGVRLRDIAKNAGVANSLLNYHFQSKMELWKQSVDHLAEKLNARYIEIQGYFKDLTGLPALKAYTRQLVYFSAEHPEFHKLVFHEMCTETERADWLIDKVLKPLHHFFGVTELNNVSGKDGFMGIPAANISSIMIGAVNIFFTHAFQMKKMYGTDPFEKAEIERHADIVIGFLFSPFENGEKSTLGNQ